MATYTADLLMILLGLLAGGYLSVRSSSLWIPYDVGFFSLPVSGSNLVIVLS